MKIKVDAEYLIALYEQARWHKWMSDELNRLDNQVDEMMKRLYTSSRNRPGLRSSDP